ncbi:hypothetical protein Tco_1323013 [Tanacetum coccineum]
MKEILHRRMFESGSYKSLPEHIALYEALEASMERANKDEFFAEKDKSRKRRRDDQDPPPPPDSDLCKKKRHDSDASGSSQPPAPQSSAWKTSDTREAPSSSSKQQSDQAEARMVEAHSKGDRPETPEPDWSIPTNDLPEPENNWANALAKSYKDPDVNKLLWKTGDMGSFISWFCKRIGKKKLSKSDLEGPTFKVAKAFHENSISLADYKEYKISEADFKNLHLDDFEDMYLLHLQGQLNHLSGDDKFHLFNATKLNLTQPDWDASDFLFKEDYTIVNKPRVVIYKDRNDQKKMMRETEVHKFSDGTLNRILDKLDHMVKDIKLYKYNPDIETQIWYVDDRRRSKDFMEVIERRLKIRRIFSNLESFVGRGLRDVDYRLIQRTE